MKGIIASPGIAIGKAFVLEQKEVVINEALLANPAECEAEVEKFRKAVAETEAQLNEIIEKTEKRLLKISRSKSSCLWVNWCIRCLSISVRLQFHW